MRRSLFLLIVVLGVLPLLLVLAAGQSAARTTIDVGAINDATAVRGFFTREDNGSDTFRWSEARASVRLPSQGQASIVTLRGAPAPDGTEVRLALTPDAVVQLAPTSALDVRRLNLYVPARYTLSGWTEVGIFSAGGAGLEERDIGFVLTDAALRAVRPGLRLPPLLPGLVLALVPLAAWLLARLLGLRPWLGAGLGLAVCAGLVAAWALRPLWILPFVPTIGGALVAYCGLAAWLRVLWRSELPAAGKLALALVVPGALLLLYQFFKYQQYLPPVPPARPRVYYLHPGWDSFFRAHDGLGGGPWGWKQWALWAALVALPLPWLASARWRRWRAPLLTAVAVLVLAYGLMNYVWVFSRDYADDFKVLFRGPRAFFAGDPLYDVAAIRENALSNLYKYPPFFALFMGPLTGLSFTPAILWWRGLNILALLAALWLLWCWSGRPWRSWSTAGLVALACLFQPLIDVLRYGQVDMLVLLGAAAALWALGKERWGWFGAAIAFVAMLKIYPAFLLLVALAHRRWRALWGFAGAALALGLLSLAVLGWDVHWTYLREVFPVSGAGTAWVENQTINGFVNRFRTTTIGLVPDSGGLSDILTYLGFAVVTAATYWACRRLTPAAGLGLALIAMLIVLPAAWIHYQVVLLLPIYQLLVRLEAAEPARPDWRTLALVAFGWSLLAFGNQWTFFDRAYLGPLWVWVLSYKLYGLAALWAAVVWDPTARRAAPAVARPRERLAHSGAAVGQGL